MYRKKPRLGVEKNSVKGKANMSFNLKNLTRQPGVLVAIGAVIVVVIAVIPATGRMLGGLVGHVRTMLKLEA